ncbi:class I SAM-dependent methyltransferase [Pendulispora albinea]|uniref:Class I SAM-dependent methyltransferase n=1 Tax=Pendulispora albinea TaxID=2741071 RepID=A0ABZ2LLA0_9BACT
MQTSPSNDLEALVDIQRYQDWILKPYSPYLRGSVLEVGAGIGSLSMHYAHSVERAVLVEPEGKRVAVLRERVAHLRSAEVVEASIESWLGANGADGADGAQHETFDAILMINVLEHIRDDAMTLRRLYERLRPGGAFLCFVPACPWLYGTLDRLVHHYRRYERKGLEALLREVGFDIATLNYFDIAGILPWWFAGRVLRQTAFNAQAAMIYDRFIVPLMSKVEQLMPPPIGKNLTCVAVRPMSETARS